MKTLTAIIVFLFGWWPLGELEPVEYDCGNLWFISMGQTTGIEDPDWKEPGLIRPRPSNHCHGGCDPLNTPPMVMP